MADQKPGKGFFGWLGRQVGHVSKAVKTDVVPKEKTTFRKEEVSEAPVPNQPGVKLRRTVIDEVIEAPKKK